MVQKYNQLIKVKINPADKAQNRFRFPREGETQKQIKRDDYGGEGSLSKKRSARKKKKVRGGIAAPTDNKEKMKNHLNVQLYLF